MTSRDKVAEDSDESSKQIQRYIRLTDLIPEPLDMVDNDALRQGEQHERMAVSPAYEISFLSHDLQQELLDAIQADECTPSLSQAKRLKTSPAHGTAA